MAQIVSDEADREYIFCRQCSLPLLANEESWAAHHLEKLTDKGRIEVGVWLKEKNLRSYVSLPRRSHETLCSGCKERTAGYPEAPHSIYCSPACRKRNRSEAPILIVEPEEPNNSQLQALLNEWVGKLTVQQLKALMGAQHIRQPKDLRKQDRIDLVVAHYLERSWGEFKEDLTLIGCQLVDIDSVQL